MADEPSDDAVRYFSDQAEAFHGLYRGPGCFHERMNLWHELLDRYAVPDGFSLDMGCGSGIFTLHLAEKGGRAIGIDGAPDMIAFCEKQRRERGLENISFIQARLPFVDEAGLTDADLIISSSVIEYVDDLDATLALFARLLKPRGILVISMPNTLSLSRIHQRVRYLLTHTPEIYRYIRHFSSPRMLHRRVMPHGLVLLESRYYTAFTRLARIGRAIGLPRLLTEDLFVAVFRKA